MLFGCRLSTEKENLVWIFIFKLKRVLLSLNRNMIGQWARVVLAFVRELLVLAMNIIVWISLAHLFVR